MPTVFSTGNKADFQPFWSCRPQSISQERCRSLARKPQPHEYKSALPSYPSRSFWKESAGLSTETTEAENRSRAQPAAWDGVTGPAFPHARLLVTQCLLFRVKLGPPHQPMLGHPEREGLQRCLETHIRLPSAAAAAGRAGLGLPGSRAGWRGSCPLEQHRSTRPVPLPQTPAPEVGRWPEDAMGAPLRWDMAVTQHGRPRHGNSRTSAFSGAKGEGAGTLHTAAPLGPSGSRGWGLLSEGL